MQRVLLLVLGLCAAAIAEQGALDRRQESVQCEAITANIGPLLAACATSTVACLSASTAGIGNIVAIQELICPPTKSVRDNIYNTLVDCRSQDFADLIYASVCGSTTLESGETLLCTDAILTINDGSAAKEACCGDGSTGPVSQCADGLRNLTRDVGCCTASLMLQTFLQSCETDDGLGLTALFDANQVDIPSLCDFPLYTEGSSSPPGSTPNAWFSLFLYSVVLMWITVTM